MGSDLTAGKMAYLSRFLPHHSTATVQISNDGSVSDVIFSGVDCRLDVCALCRGRDKTRDIFRRLIKISDFDVQWNLNVAVFSNSHKSIVD